MSSYGENLTCVSLWVTNMETCTRWIWKHIQNIFLWLVHVTLWCLESIVLLPKSLPFWFDISKWVGCWRSWRGISGGREKTETSCCIPFVGRNKSFNTPSSSDQEHHCGNTPPKRRNFKRHQKKMLRTLIQHKFHSVRAKTDCNPNTV